MLSLQDDSTKRKVINMDENGYSQKDISLATGIPRSTIGDFLRGESHQIWWASFKALKDGGEGPRFLFADIETSPLVSFHWRLFNENISVDQMILDTQILCWSAKWLGEDEVFHDDARGDWPMTDILSENFEPNYDDQIVMLENLWKLLDEADFVCGHNLRRFDVGKINDKFLQFGFPQPSPYKIVDTLKIVKGQFNTPSNKLQYWTKHLGQDGKLQHEGFSLWKKCVQGDQEAWETMIEYCDQDVTELEDFYLRIRGWDTYHPNVALHYGDDKIRCNTCGSDDMKLLEGKTAQTNLSLFEVMECQNCGAHKRLRKNLRSKEQMQNTLMNITK